MFYHLTSLLLGKNMLVLVIVCIMEFRCFQACNDYSILTSVFFHHLLQCCKSGHKSSLKFELTNQLVCYNFEHSNQPIIFNVTTVTANHNKCSKTDMCHLLKLTNTLCVMDRQANSWVDGQKDKGEVISMPVCLSRQHKNNVKY